MHCRLGILVALISSVSVSALPTWALTPSDLVGVWGERRALGPNVSGVLTVTLDGAAGRAEITGRAVDIRCDGAQVDSALSGGQGRFRGRIAGDSITGHWIQPRTIAFGSAYATPVVLHSVSSNVWRGVVTPLADEMTFYLRFALDSAGDLRCYFRNPDRNAGRFMPVKRVALDGNTVNFMAGTGSEAEVLATGQYSPDDQCLSVFLPWAGGTYDFSRQTAVDLAGFYPRGDSAAKYSYQPPPQLVDGWPTADLENVGLSRDSIEQFIQMLIDMPMVSNRTLDVHGVLIARHGTLVLEEYFHGFNRDELHDTRSASKTMTSTVTGAANLSGYSIDPALPVYATMLGVDSAKTHDARARAITVEHLLTMSSGLNCDDSDEESPGNEDRMQEQRDQPDWVQYTLDLGMLRNPGEEAVYCSCNPNLLGGVLSKITGKWIPELFDELIDRPMKFGHYAINLMPNGEAYAGGGMRLLPRDFMKIGQMMLNGGRWQGRQIVSEEWAARATSPVVVLEEHGYGYYWWIERYPYRGDTVSAFFAGGNGGQIVMGIPALDIVIAFYAGNYSDMVFLTLQREYVPKYLLPALVRNQN